MAELLVAFMLAVLLGVIGWALFGLLLMPVFHRQMITLCFVRGDGTVLEQRVRSFGWLRECKERGGRLIVVDCGLTKNGLEIYQRLRENRPWLSYCPNEALTDHIELVQHCLENDEDLL